MAKVDKKTISKEASEIKTVRSPDWKEVYIDEVSLITDKYVTRLLCINHCLNITGINDSVNTEKVIKADIIVPNAALTEIVTALSEVVKDNEKRTIKKKTSVEVKD
ncbi:MAG: hypothetical protein FIB08_04615 [Candidatus Methanoperedens sp.]|nr:hypothetical protein [Candidatus Methanoperedens sp.]